MPYPGGTISINIGGETKEYVVSGIYKKTNIFGVEQRGRVPDMYLYHNDEFLEASNRLDMFLQIDNRNNSDYEYISNICRKYKDLNEYDVNFEAGRVFAYAYLLGLNIQIAVDNMTEINQAVLKHESIYDADTKILIYFVSGVVFLTGVMLLYHFFKTIFYDRLHNIGIMCGLGRKIVSCVCDIIIEITCIVITVFPIGIIGSNYIYTIIRHTINDNSSFYIEDALKSNYYINSVTISPILLTAVIIIITMIVTDLFFVFRFNNEQLSLIQMINGEYALAKRKNKGKVKKDFTSASGCLRYRFCFFLEVR